MPPLGIEKGVVVFGVQIIDPVIPCGNGGTMIFRCEVSTCVNKERVCFGRLTGWRRLSVFASQKPVAVKMVRVIHSLRLRGNRYKKPPPDEQTGGISFDVASGRMRSTPLRPLFLFSCCDAISIMLHCTQGCCDLRAQIGVNVGFSLIGFLLEDPKGFRGHLAECPFLHGESHEACTFSLLPDARSLRWQ